MRKLWIHIGTPKTGSTAVQRYSRLRRRYLARQGVDFLQRRRLASYNDLAVHLMQREHAPCQSICADIRNRIANSPAETFVITSEMLGGCDPVLFRELLALDETFDLRILAYFRRQDRYFENAYKQKLKTGKVRPGFENYINKFGTKGGDYLKMISRWEAAFPEAEFVFRRFDPARFPKGDVVYDFMALLGLDIEADDKPPSDEAANPTPTIDLLDLMQIVAALPELDTRRVFRTMPIHNLPRWQGRAMDHETARRLLAEFEEQNEVLRARFFPEDEVLFETSDLDGPTPRIAESSFTEDQHVLIRALLDAVVKVQARGS